ncbi:hypothetical protein TIFTF001_030464 [Ficus carica]|uniref:Uncharacterized protein n=1 Tax=Ficus carica TaxID=3494 RepID=A0AA88DT66_FICCA|nr:hypothetical protein TIFTF001_030464 [Ficus carica]
MSNNMLPGKILPYFVELKNLTLLNLFRNKFYGVISEFIGEMPELELLREYPLGFGEEREVTGA